MGLFDNLKSKIENVASDLKENIEEMDAKSITTLCDEIKELKSVDPKKITLSMSIAAKCEGLDDFDLEDLYLELKKQGTFLKKHPAEKVVLEELIRRNIYCRSDDDTVSRNMLAKKRPRK